VALTPGWVGGQPSGASVIPHRRGRCGCLDDVPALPGLKVPSFAASLGERGCQDGLSQAGGPLDDQASALVSGGGVVPFVITPSEDTQRPHRVARTVRMLLG
jgi:hypothetical protein